MSKKSEKQSPLILVDGSSYLYRAFHALPPLVNSAGQPTGAVKGVINMIKSLQKEYSDSELIIVFDAKGKTFRDDIFAEYKANRPPMPDDLRVQVGPIFEIIRAMGLPLVIIDGVEADDVIGSLSKQCSAKGEKVLVSTGDKDMAQLVDDNVTLVNTMTNTVLDTQGVINKFGIPPELIIDFLALMGDKVDNIPGVAGVGEKTALALIQALGGVDTIYNKLDEVAEVKVRGAKSLGEKLKKEEANAKLSYKLATIKTDVDVDLNSIIEEFNHNKQDNIKLLELFTRLEFKSWVSEVSKKLDPDAREENNSVNEKKYEVILDKKDLDGWIKKLKKAELFAFDTETTSLNYQEARVVGVSFSCEHDKAAYVPFGHDYLDAPEQLDEEEVLGKLKPLLEDEKQKKVGQNLKYDKHVIANHGIELNGIADDTMLMSYIINSVSNRHDMDSLALAYLNHQTIHFEDIAGKGAKQLTFNQIPLETAGPYAAEDADITLKLHHELMQILKKDEKLYKLYKEIELPLLTVITEIEKNGTLIDSKMLLEQSQQLNKRMQELEKNAYDLAGEEFNLSSPKQLQAILFEKLKLPVIKKTPKGQPSTAEPILHELALDYPLPKVIMEYRGLSKLKSTYTDRLPEQVFAKTGRIHTSYHQAVTATGRLSSSDPNLQNIPIRTEEGRRVRKAFVAPEEFSILAADYSQIELRIMSHLSKDNGLLQAFNDGLDVHKATASEVFGVGIEAVSSDQRRKAKAINFGLIYGMSAFGLGKQLGIGRNDAQAYIDKYFEKYPGVREYMDKTRSKAAGQGYVETLFGRRLYLPEIKASNAMRRQAAERTAINAPMQGTAADIIKIAMINVHNWIQKENNHIKMIMQVHDELVFEVPNKIADSAKETICEIMSSAATIDVPLVVDANVGSSWDEAH